MKGPSNSPEGSKEPASGPYIVTLDVGSSSVRTLLFDGRAREVPGLSAHLGYELVTTQDGGVEVDADGLAEMTIQAIDQIHQRLAARGLRPDAVASCTFWHNVLGVNANGGPTTPVIHPFDTRSAAAARKLAQRIDNRRQHAR
ncbi:MAG TPA: FGGY family carbohydrate kinase, partial [Terriglobia bacterium]|nr:FGGY family carbohydrate kinase [Terriglobia bacterium]